MTDSWSEPGDLEGRRLDKALHHAFIREEPATHGSVFDVLGREGEEIPRVLLRELPAGSELHSSSPSGASDFAGHLPETYRVAGEIAEGGAGVVLRVRDLVLGRDVAVKLLRSCHRQRPSMVRRFLEEAQIGGQLQHPGIVPVHEIGVTADQRPFFSMKLVQGQTLAELLASSAESAARERPRLVRIFAQICQTMAYAHARGVIHRDLKPANVMVGAYGEVQVMDWGMAKVLDMALDAAAMDEGEIATLRSTDPSTASVTGSVMGTPAYMPPEQARGETERLDERSDVFSLGAILCEILTGAPPYTVATADELKRAAAHGDLTAARQHLQDCGADPELVQLAASCLRHEPDDRPAHAGVLAEVVSSHLTSVEERARQAELEAARAAGEAAQERRSRRLSAALFASILCTATVGGGAWVWWDRTERQRAQSDQRAAQHDIEEVLQLEGEAKAPGPAAVSRWAVALAAAERATAAAAADAVEPDLRARAAAVRSRVEARHAAAVAAAAQAAADRRMAERLDEIDMAVTSGWDWSEFDARTTAAFREYGIDVDALKTEEAVRRVRESPLYGRIVNTLEGWATARSLSRPPGDPAAAQRVRELARHIEPDPWLEQLRTAIYERWDRDRLRALVKAPQALERPLSTVMIADHIGWAGDPALAAELWRRAQLDSPGDFWVNLQLGYWLSQCGPQAGDEALRAFTAALALRPKSAVAHVNVGWLLVSRGDLDRGQAWLEKALELEPGFAPAHVNLGYLREQRGELDLAIGSYREAIRLDPGLPIPHHNLGAILRRQGALDVAIAEFRAALALEPTRLATHRLLAHTLQRTDQLEEAITVWRTACDLDPNDATSHIGLGRALREAGRLEEALTALRRGHELGSGDPGWTYPSARWVAECQQMWEAQQRLVPMLQGGRPPADAAEAVALAELCRGRGELVAAARFRKQALGLDPELASDLPGGHLFAAARDAVAASAQEDAAAWRREALTWLQSALGMWRDQAAGGGLGRAKARRRLRQWQQESALARVRDPDALTRIPADEQEQWHALWDEVARLCAR